MSISDRLEDDQISRAAHLQRRSGRTQSLGSDSYEAQRLRCYNVRHMGESRVGVRELRQNLSRYLDDVRRGRHFEVTDRGEPVALLVPLPEAASPLEKLILAGRATAPREDLLRLGPPRGRVTQKASEALRLAREERL